MRYFVMHCNGNSALWEAVRRVHTLLTQYMTKSAPLAHCPWPKVFRQHSLLPAPLPAPPKIYGVTRDPSPDRVINGHMGHDDICR